MAGTSSVIPGLLWRIQDRIDKSGVEPDARVSLNIDHITSPLENAPQHIL